MDQPKKNRVAFLRVGLLVSVLLPLGIALLLTGCRGTGGRVALSGEVSLDGKPLKKGAISFVPQGEGLTPTGGMITDGHYDIPAAKGLKPGEYIAKIVGNPSDPVAEQESAEELMIGKGRPKKGYATPKQPIPAKYNTASELKIKVTSSGPNKFDFELDSE